MRSHTISGVLYLRCAATTSWNRPLTKDAASGMVQEPWTQFRLAELKLAQGDPVAAQALLAQVPLDFSPMRAIWSTRFNAALYLRDYDAANRVIAATPAKLADDAFDGQPPESWADGQVARARGDKQKALAVFAAARKKMEATWGDKPKDAYVLRATSRDLMLGLAEKKTRSARHCARSISCRLPRTRIGVRHCHRPGAGLRVDRRARPRARATRNCRDDPGWPDIRRSPLQSVLG